MSQLTVQASRISAMAGSRFLLIWLTFAAVLIAVPQMFSSGTAVSLLSQMGTAMIFGLSYNMLLGQGGMLSFGHAVYSGLGAFMTVHAMNLAGGGTLWLPLPLAPLVGGFAGLVFAALIGYVTTRKSGITFAMVTLGIGEMVFASSLMLPAFFGGEGGISTNRVYGERFFGLNFGSQLQVYYLIAVWLLLCTAAVYAFTQTPLGRIINAVRDNAERTEFIGYDPQWARYLTLILSGFFAGVSGALGAISFEIATAENLSGARSGAVLLFTFIGGIDSFAGPMVGAIVGVLMTVMLSDYTQAWHMYLGLLFVLIVIYAPGGISSLFAPTKRLLCSNQCRRIWPQLLMVVCAGVLALVGGVIVIELLYRRAAGAESMLVVLGYILNHKQPTSWLIGGVALATGLLFLKTGVRGVRLGLEAEQTSAVSPIERNAA